MIIKPFKKYQSQINKIFRNQIIAKDFRPKVPYNLCNLQITKEILHKVLKKLNQFLLKSKKEFLNRKKNNGYL